MMSAPARKYCSWISVTKSGFEMLSKSLLFFTSFSQSLNSSPIRKNMAISNLSQRNRRHIFGSLTSVVFFIELVSLDLSAHAAIKDNYTLLKDPVQVSLDFSDVEVVRGYVLILQTICFDHLRKNFKFDSLFDLWPSFIKLQCCVT